MLLAKTQKKLEHLMISIILSLLALASGNPANQLDAVKMASDGEVLAVSDSRGVSFFNISDGQMELLSGLPLEGVTDLAMNEGIVFTCLAGKVAKIDARDPEHPLVIDDGSDSMTEDESMLRRSSADVLATLRPTTRYPTRRPTTKMPSRQPTTRAPTKRLP